MVKRTMANTLGDIMTRKQIEFLMAVDRGNAFRHCRNEKSIAIKGWVSLRKDTRCLVKIPIYNIESTFDLPALVNELSYHWQDSKGNYYTCMIYDGSIVGCCSSTVFWLS